MDIQIRAATTNDFKELAYMAKKVFFIVHKQAIPKKLIALLFKNKF